MIEFEQEERKKIDLGVRIKVIGIGGAGGNTINSIVRKKNDTIECIAANTDAQALNLSNADHIIQLGVKSTKGLGTGANPDLGKRAAEEDLERVMELVSDADIVFLTAGLGGGTGSGALPVIARAVKEKGILTIAIVTKPFAFEGRRRFAVAEQSLAQLKKEVDILIVVPNQKLLERVGTHVSMVDAFELINEILNDAIQSISGIISKPGHINVDFADVRAIMKDMGLAVMGTGRASGPNRAIEAAQTAISCELLESMDIAGASGVLLNVTGGTDLTLHELSAAASVIYEKADENANIILGSVIDPECNDQIAVTIIATGFERATAAMPKEVKADIEPEPNPVIIKQAPTRITAAVVENDLTPARSNTKQHEASRNPEIFAQDILDVPTFLRQSSEEESSTHHESSSL